MLPQATTMKAQEKGMVPAGAPRIKHVYVYQIFFKMLRDGIPAETVRMILWSLHAVLYIYSTSNFFFCFLSCC